MTKNFVQRSDNHVKIISFENNNFCFHVNAQKCQVVGLSGCQVRFLGTLDQWLTSGTVPDRYPGFFTCPTTRSIKIVCPTGIEFSKSSEAFPHAAKNCDRLVVWKSQSENFSRLAIVGNYILGIPAVQLRRRDSFLPREEQ